MNTKTLEAIRSFARKVKSVVSTNQKPEGWLITLQCGHEDWSETWPASPHRMCTECINEFNDATPKKRK